MTYQAQDDMPWLAAAAAGLMTMRPTRPAGEVTILLALYNGARFIEAQLDSFARQTHPDWRLVVSDDGSKDDGAMRVLDWADRHPERELRLIDGPRRGFAANFLHLLAAVEPGAPYVAFSDQDDVWLPGKLAHAVATLAELPASMPAIYCGRRLICDQSLQHVKGAERWGRPPDFRNALVQNITPGNTIVMNRAALRLLQAAARRVRVVYAHDWWAYLMVTGAGGRVIRDAELGLLYRQHDANVVGARRGLRAHLRAAGHGLSGQLRRWQDMNIEALQLAEPYLTRESRSLLAAYAAARQAPWYARPARLRRLGLFRQTRLGTFGLWLVAALGML